MIIEDYVDILIKKTRGGDKRIIKYVSLFINVNETSDWGLGESVGKYEYEGV